MKVRLMTAAAAAALVAGTLFAGAQDTKSPKAPKLDTESGMPSDQGTKTGKKGGTGTGTQTGTQKGGKQPGGASNTQPPEQRDTVRPGGGK